MSALPYVSHRLFAAAVNRPPPMAQASSPFTGGIPRQPASGASRVNPSGAFTGADLELVDSLPAIPPRPLVAVRQQA